MPDGTARAIHANMNATIVAAHTVLLSVLNCRNQLQRVAYCYGTLRRPDASPLLVGLDYALEQGWIAYGTTNASARAWSRGASEGLLYLTKSGKTWLRSHGSDFGSGALFSEKLRIATEMARAARVAA